MNIIQEIDNVEAEIISLQKKKELFERLAAKFPDLEVHTNRWGVKRFSSKIINEIAEDAEFAHSCGCCYDAALYIRPYIEFENLRIYSDPVDINIGEGTMTMGDTYYPDFIETLKKHNISKKVIKLARKQQKVNERERRDW